jgi:hypothetical protein
MDEKIPVTAVLMGVTKATRATATIAAIKAYSKALAPSSFRDHLAKNLFTFNMA